MLDALLGLGKLAQRDKGSALEVQDVLLVDPLGLAELAAAEHVRQVAGNLGVVRRGVGRLTEQIDLDLQGRQRIAADSLLNRWIVAMGRGVDEITQPSGEVFTIPFDVRLIFATAFEPSSLMPEAFLRRIPYKIQIPDPGPTELREIIRRACEQEGVTVRDEGLDHLLSRAFSGPGPSVRAVSPMDLVHIIHDTADFDGRQPELTAAMIDEAWDLYFLRESSVQTNAASLA